MAFPCLRLPSTSSACCCSSAAASIVSTSRAAGPMPSGCLLSASLDGFRSVAPGGMSLIRSGSHNSCSRSRRRTPSFSVRAGIRAVETYDASFQLQPEADKTLRESLSSKTFCVQVAQQNPENSDAVYEFTGELFQPVPWSPTTKFGMPMEFEKYLQDKENYTIINVPPNFMFKAKVEEEIFGEKNSSVAHRELTTMNFGDTCADIQAVTSMCCL